MNKVSLIMPSLNVAPYIEECIKSAVNQTLQDIEIICVDAGSDDGTLDIIEKYDYTTNMAAKSLRVSKSNTIGVIVPDINNLFLQNLF